MALEEAAVLGVQGAPAGGAGMEEKLGGCACEDVRVFLDLDLLRLLFSIWNSCVPDPDRVLIFCCPFFSSRSV
jgi:hypothetical protein